MVLFDKSRGEAGMKRLYVRSGADARLRWPLRDPVGAGPASAGKYDTGASDTTIKIGKLIP